MKKMSGMWRMTLHDCLVLTEIREPHLKGNDNAAERYTALKQPCSYWNRPQRQTCTQTSRGAADALLTNASLHLHLPLVSAAPALQEPPPRTLPWKRNTLCLSYLRRILNVRRCSSPCCNAVCYFSPLPEKPHKVRLEFTKSNQRKFIMLT